MSLPKEIADFMATYKVNADELWQVRPGTYAIKHKALERVGAEQGIRFFAPDIIHFDMEKREAAIVVHGKLGEREEWSTGEASTYNNKNAYPFAMAEKRAKDRVGLKLLNAHGAIYSEDEADDFKQPPKRENPHVTRPEDLSDAKIEVDPATGEIIDNIPLGDPSVETLSKKNARADYEAALKEMESAATPKQLETWGQRNKDRVQSYPSDWAEILRMRFAEHRDYLRGK
jgi:hypothetical protein